MERFDIDMFGAIYKERQRENWHLISWNESQNMSFASATTKNSNTLTISRTGSNLLLKRSNYPNLPYTLNIQK